MSDHTQRMVEFTLEQVEVHEGIINKHFPMEYAHDYASLRYMILLEDPESFIHKLSICLHS